MCTRLAQTPNIYEYKNTCFMLFSCLIIFCLLYYQRDGILPALTTFFLLYLRIILVMLNECIDTGTIISTTSRDTYIIVLKSFTHLIISNKILGLPTKCSFMTFFFLNIQTKHRGNIENYQFHNIIFFSPI